MTLARAALIFPAAILCAQPQPTPVFEVAAIKPSSPQQDASSGVTTKTNLLSARNVTLKRLIRAAYNIPQPQIFGGPKWVDEDRFDIDAKPASPADDRQLASMLQSLLAERFQLVMHHETKLSAGYALVPEKSGLKLKRADPDAEARTNSHRGAIDAQGCSMNNLALRLAETLQLPVADFTGIEGAFDLKLEWAPDDMKTTPAATGPSLFQAVQDQLGLKLESRKLPTQVLIIDSAAKPSAN